MKKSELRQLIREEIEKEYQLSYEHMIPYSSQIRVIKNNLMTINDKIEIKGPLSEDIMDAIEALDEFLNKL